ncbi:MAG: hypothetical protein PHQ20_04510 [Candidatus Moranbacteria bacterium]|nr:hypothetical protein [Candidatus Moranbacteria bacterium]
MFGTNKKKDPSRSISMEIESMEKDLAGKGSIKEDIEIDLDKSYSELEKKNLEPVQKPDLDKKMTKMSFGPKKDLQKEEAGGSLAKKFISPEKRINNDYFLHPLPNKEKEVARDKKTPRPKKNTLLLEEVEKKPTQGSGPDKKPTPSFAGNPFLDKNFDKSTKLKEKETLEEEPASGLNWPILSMIVVTFMVAVLSGAYYYFFVLKKTSDVPTEEITAVTEENILEEEAVVIYPEIETNDGNPSALEESEKIELKEQNIFESIKSIPLEKINIPEGKVFAISENANLLNAPSLINKLGVKLPEQIIANFDRGWIFLKKLEGENMRIGLLLEIKDAEKIDSLKTSILKIEKELPEALDALYPEDQLPIYEPKDISFSDSLFYDNFRYFNFYPGKTNPSLDWGIKKYQKDNQSNSFMIFSTSKELTKNILDLLSR